MTLKICGSQGEWALYSNTLSATGADTLRQGSVFIDDGEEMFKQWPSPSNDTWVHVRMAGTDFSSTYAHAPDHVFLEISDTNGDDIVRFRGSGVAGQSVWDFNVGVANSAGGGFSYSAERFASGNLVFEEYDVHIAITTGSATDDTLTVTFYKNAQQRYQVVVVDATGWAQPDRLRLTAKDTGFSGSDNWDHTYYQDVIVTDGVPTPGMELGVMDPNAVGDGTDFNNDYQNIDENGYDQLDLISANVVGDRESWTFAAPSFSPGDKVIYAVVMDAVAQKDVGNTIDMRPFVRITLTDYPNPQLNTSNIVPDSYPSAFLQNPATLQPWTLADLTALEIGVEAVTP